MLLATAEQRRGLANRLARAYPGRRDPTRILHCLADMFRPSRFTAATRTPTISIICAPIRHLSCLTGGCQIPGGPDPYFQPTLPRLTDATTCSPPSNRLKISARQSLCISGD
jgi:hypothetical protein